MHPTLKDGKVYKVESIQKRTLSVGDVVKIKFSRKYLQCNGCKKCTRCKSANNVSYMAKRVVAKEGDWVLLVGRACFVNPFSKINGSAVNSNEMSYQQVKRGYVFVLGDNHKFSRDSRDFGMIPLKVIVGRVLVKPKQITCETQAARSNNVLEGIMECSLS